MHGILRRLSSDARVLDLGSRCGSFRRDETAAKVIRCDLEFPGKSMDDLVVCDAAALPFRAGSFDAVIANHVMEHFDGLECALRETGRVIRSEGALYVSVPDASTWTDKIYRWLARGGGHVNPFRDPGALACRVARSTGLGCRGYRTLHTSLSFLNRRNLPAGKVPLKLWLFGGGAGGILRILTWMARNCDELLGSRSSIYGWEFWFGSAECESGPPCRNVCVRCGSGHPAGWLHQLGRVKGLFPRYNCPGCGAGNWFTPD